MTDGRKPVQTEGFSSFLDTDVGKQRRGKEGGEREKKVRG